MQANRISAPSEKAYIGRFCAIDIGTVTCRMLIADAYLAANNSVFVKDLDKQYEIVNLGEGVDATKRLSSNALSRTKQTLEKYIDVRESFNTQERPVINTMCVATSATRDAQNSHEFVNIMNDLGLELTIVSGSQEASLSFSGASSSFVGEKVVVIDVGGGSTEIVAGIGGDKIEFSHSFDIGSRRMTERFWDDYPCSKDQLAKARDWAARIFAGIPSDIGEGSRLIAVAGTATSVVTIDKQMREYDANIVNGAEVDANALANIENRLESFDLLHLEEVVGLDPRRAPVIVGGMIILQEAMKALHSNAFTASESDILEGIVMYNAKQYIASK